MSGHTRMHLTSAHSRHTAVLYMTYDHKTYAIPERVAEKYRVSKRTLKDAIPADIVFEKLEKNLTKAGILLKGLRTREGLSQVAFAKKIGINQANLSSMENGRRPIGKIIAKRIEKVFGVNYRYFLG